MVPVPIPSADCLPPLFLRSPQGELEGSGSAEWVLTLFEPLVHNGFLDLYFLTKGPKTLIPRNQYWHLYPSEMMNLDVHLKMFVFVLC